MLTHFLVFFFFSFGSLAFQFLVIEVVGCICQRSELPCTRLMNSFYDQPRFLNKESITLKIVSLTMLPHMIASFFEA